MRDSLGGGRGRWRSDAGRWSTSGACLMAALALSASGRVAGDGASEAMVGQEESGVAVSTAGVEARVLNSNEPPEIPFGFDAFTSWDRWPYLRIGVRAYMRSTFDREGGNHNVDAAHFLRQVDDDEGGLRGVGPPRFKGLPTLVRTRHAPSPSSIGRRR